MITIFCPDCDTPLDAHSRYCYHCGRLVTVTGKTTPLTSSEFKYRFPDHSAFLRSRTIIVFLMTAIFSFLGGFLLYPSLTRPTTYAPVSPIPGSLSATSISTSVPAATSLSPTYVALNIQQHPTFTLYWKRDLWEQAVGADFITEDFAQDTADYGELGFPYLTGHGLLLQGQSSAQILDDRSLLGSGTLLHFRDWKQGLTIHFPNDTPLQAFGFDYRASEPWKLNFNTTEIPLPKGRKGFVGIVVHNAYPQAFVLSSTEGAQGGLSMDNIGFMPIPPP